MNNLKSIVLAALLLSGLSSAQGQQTRPPVNADGKARPSSAAPDPQFQSCF